MAEATGPKKIVRVLFFEEGARWVAVSLEHYLLVQGDSYETARSRFERAIGSYVRTCLGVGAEPFNDLPPAPERFQRMFDEAEFLVRQKFPPSPAIPVEFEARAVA